MTPKKFYLILLNNIHPFYDRNCRTCKVLFANDDKINLLMRKKLKRSNNIKLMFIELNV